MATIYVDDGGSNTSPYDTWAKAATTLQTALTAWSAGNDIWVASDHYETYSSSQTLNWTGNTNAPTPIFSVNSSTDAYTKATSAQFEVTGSGNDITIGDGVVCHGMYFKADDQIRLLGVFPYYFKDCTFAYSQGGSGGNGFQSVHTQGKYYIEDCTLDGHSSNTSINHHGMNAGDETFKNCTWTQGNSQSLTFILNRNTGAGRVFACDFSSISHSSGAALFATSGYGGYYKIHNCNFNSSFSRHSSSGLGYSRTTNAQQAAVTVNGASTGKLYDFYIDTPYGDVTHTASIYRTSGFVDADGSTPIAHIMEPDDSGCSPDLFPLFGAKLMGYYGSTGSVTFRVEALQNYTTAPTKDELWMEVFYLGTSNSTRWSKAGGRSIWSTSNWTTSTVGWTGASGYSKIKLEQAATINKAGPYMVQLWLGKYENGKSVVYCPKVEIDT